ncbi:MAG TPA: diguanylate cyclase [Blastocatellia bacterium]|jgi:diguanylate cyclase (GGDEF)-like protein/putative nucleotidyltransferase with HDIG domain|nr:diguanylate cyclase [Blastocatellia bacterium]
MASTAAAGLTVYSLSSHLRVVIFLMLALALPVPLIIYYAFKTYHSKIEDERRHTEQMNEVHRSTLEALAMAIDAKDQTTHQHIRRVQIYARRMGENMRMGAKELKALEAASLLHDIGKLGVPDYILNKPGKLTEHEFNKMKSHPVIGAEILSNVKFDFPVASYVRAHHERWDGRGYPDGLAGEEIPLGARILALVDHFDALHSDRPYRKAMTREEALRHIKEQSGAFFDPVLVKLFLDMLESLNAEIDGLGFQEPEAPRPAQAIHNSSAPAAGFAEEQSPLTESALGKIAAAHKEVMTLHDIARVLSSSLSLQDTVAIVASRLANVVPYSTCVIYLADADKTRVRAQYAGGLNRESFRNRVVSLGEGITGWVVANHKPMYNTSPLLDLAFLGSEAASAYKSVLVFPVMKQGEAFGAVALYSVDLPNYTNEHLRLIEMVMQPISDALHNAMTFESTRQTALTDQMTGLPNMRAFSMQLERELHSAERAKYPLSVLVIDINDFKQVNDTFGHLAGDRFLFQVGQVIRRQLRDHDMVARFTGDEFVACLTMTDHEQTGHVIKRIQKAIGQLVLDMPGGESVTVTASIGAATSPRDGWSFEELMMQADRRMYRSKEELRTGNGTEDAFTPFPKPRMLAS